MFNVYTGDTLSRSRCYGNVVLDPTGTGSSFSLRLLVLLHRAPLPVSVDVVIVERWNGHGRERERKEGEEVLASPRTGKCGSRIYWVILLDAIVCYVTLLTREFVRDYWFAGFLRQLARVIAVIYTGGIFRDALESSVSQLFFFCHVICSLVMKSKLKSLSLYRWIKLWIFEFGLE